MAITIVSIKEKQGEFQGRAYHNFNLFGLKDDGTNEQVIAGCEVKEFKIKADNFVSALNRNIKALANPGITHVKDIIGLCINPVYDEWGNVSDFTLLVPEKKK